MVTYHIVKIGDFPETEAARLSEGKTCAVWYQSKEKEHTEVVSADLSGKVLHRYTPREASAVAARFLRPVVGQ